MIPSLLFLQLSARLPAVVLPLGRSVCARWPRRTRPRRFPSCSRRSPRRRRRRRTPAAHRRRMAPSRGNAARRLADVALAANLPEVSDVFLGQGRQCARPEAGPGPADSGTTATSARPSRPSTAPALRDGGNRPAWPAEAAIYAGAAPSLQRQDLRTGSRPDPSSADEFTAAHRQRLRPALPLHRCWPSRKPAGTCWRSPGWATPCRSANSSRRPPTPWTGSGTSGSCPPRWPRPLTPGCSNRRRNCSPWPWNSGRASCTPPRTTSTDSWCGPWPRPSGFPGSTRSAANWPTPGPPPAGPEARNSEKYRLFQNRETEVMRDADLVLTLGQAMKANIVAAGIPGEQGHHCAQRRRRSLPRPSPLDKASARRELGLAEDGQFIGTVSSLVPYEGIEDLLAAFVLLAADIASAPSPDRR